MSKVIIFYFFTILLGVILAVHLAMNSVVGSALRNPRVGNASSGALVRWQHF